MKILELSKEGLVNIVAKYKEIGRGSFGIVYKFDDYTLFKFNYKDFFTCFKVEDGVIKLKELGDISLIIDKVLKRNTPCFNGKYITERMVNLLKKKDEVKLTDLTQGAVFVENYCVGYLLNYHKDMVNLYKYWRGKNIKGNDKLIVYKNIEKAVNELVDNNIFMRDLTMHNIMINPQTNQIQIIDFEDYNTDLREDRPKYLIKEVSSQLHIIRDLILGKKLSKEIEGLNY